MWFVSPKPFSKGNTIIRGVLLYIPSTSTWVFWGGFLWIGLWLERGVGGGGRLEILWKSKTKGLLCSNEACPSRDRAWARLNLSHNREPTMKQTLPWCSDYCAGARHSCGESHLGVGGNKCFFNWNTGISSCFLHVFYESPVPIVWNFALTSPRRPGLIERVSVWNRFKRNLCLSVMRVCLFQGRVWLRV